MSAALKLGLLQAAVLAAALAAWKAGLDRLVGQVLLLSASFLVGVLLAVFGQIYQTGADSWELFAGWAALIAGWVALSRFAPLWIMETILVSLALAAWWEEVAQEREGLLFLLLAGVAGGAHAAFEAGARRGVPWMKPAWPRLVLWAGFLNHLTVVIGLLIFDSRAGLWEALGFLLFLGTLGGGLYYYWRIRPSLLSLTLGAAAASTATLMFAGRILFDASAEPAAFLGFGFLILAVVGGAVMGLRAIARTLEPEHE
jgi:uncharacterized membrane protein